LRQLASRHSPLCLLPDHIIPCSGTFYGLPWTIWNILSNWMQWLLHNDAVFLVVPDH
jgi:hypothetical protein